MGRGLSLRDFTKINVLGRTGMLGSMLEKTWELPFTDFWGRDKLNAEDPAWLRLEFLSFGQTVNCIGLIKPYCDDVPKAIRVNAIFPHSLPEGTIQIATDCVYSGTKGNYVETDSHDATDTYGKTKSLGEAPHLKNLRCSIIGPEIKNHLSLHDWFLSQEKANGFTNHLWNGITTLHFSKIVQGAIREDIKLPPVQHIVPADIVSKAELLRILAEAYKKDIPVTDTEDSEGVMRTLSTNNPDMNLRLWKAAGYSSPPTIKDMVEELAQLKS